MNGKVLVLATDSLGQGDAELGAQILETYLVLLKRRADRPHAIFCLNRGVLALTERSLACVHLAELERSGVRVLACRTCVDHYGVERDLRAGAVSTMAELVELSATRPVVTLA